MNFSLSLKKYFYIGNAMDNRITFRQLKMKMQLQRNFRSNFHIRIL